MPARPAARLTKCFQRQQVLCCWQWTAWNSCTRSEASFCRRGCHGARERAENIPACAIRSYHVVALLFANAVSMKAMALKISCCKGMDLGPLLPLAFFEARQELSVFTFPLSRFVCCIADGRFKEGIWLAFQCKSGALRALRSKSLSKSVGQIHHLALL